MLPLRRPVEDLWESNWQFGLSGAGFAERRLLAATASARSSRMPFCPFGNFGRYQAPGLLASPGGAIATTLGAREVCPKAVRLKVRRPKSGFC